MFFIQMNMDFVFVQKMNHLLNFCILEILDWNLIMLLEKLEYLNQTIYSTLLVVTHDAFTASYATRVIFIKDGRIFNEIYKGSDSRKEFFDNIINVVTLLGGDLNDAV